VDLGRSSLRGQEPTLQNDSFGGRLQTGSPEFKSLPEPWVENENKHGTHKGYTLCSSLLRCVISKGSEKSSTSAASPPKNYLYRILPGSTGHNLGALWEHFPARKGVKWGCLG
jgi:hypothetical protein